MGELQQLRDRVAELEALIGVDRDLPLRELLRPAYWHRDCEPMCGMLLKQEFVGRERAFIALYGGRTETDQPDIKIIDIVVCRLRQALRPYQVAIATSWGRGYYMTADNKRRLRALLDRLKAERA